MKNKSLIIETTVTVTCCVCNRQFIHTYSDNRNRTKIIDDLRRQGYTIGKYVNCPDCRTRAKRMGM